MRNKKNRFFLASTQNYFGNWKVDAVMLDSGCNSMLLPLQHDQISLVKNSFPVADFKWKIRSSLGVASQSLTLIISARDQSKKFAIELCRDIRVDCVSHCDSIRFHLSNAVMSELKNCTYLTGVDRQKLTNFVQSGFKSRERKHALLGQAVMKYYPSIQYQSLYVIFHSEKHRILDLYDITYIDTFIEEWAELPEGFDDLEDEDHDGDDEDAYLFGPDDYIDE